MAKVRGVNESYLIGIELVKKNEEVEVLNKQISILKHNFDYTINKSEEAYNNLEKKHKKTIEEYGILERENYKLRDLLKDLL